MRPDEDIDTYFRLRVKGKLLLIVSDMIGKRRTYCGILKTFFSGLVSVLGPMKLLNQVIRRGLGSFSLLGQNMS